MCEVLDQQQIGRKFDSQTKEALSAPDSKTDSTSNSNVGATNNCLKIQDYFRSNASKQEDKKVSRLLTIKIYNEFSDIFTGSSCFKGTFKLGVREGSCLYQAPLKWVIYALQESL